MSDQLTGLGSNTTIFRIAADWSRDQSEEQEISRDFIEFPGTCRRILLLSTESPAKIALDFSLQEKSEIDEFFDFARDRLGRWGAFWFPSPMSHFNISGNYHTGDQVLYVDHTSFLYNYHGRERVYIEKTNGDFLTFAVTDAYAGLEEDDPMILELGAQLAADIKNEDVNRCGMLFFGRIDQDEIDFDFLSDNVCRVSLNFIELPKEYPA